jgi:hypothetical protein
MIMELRPVSPTAKAPASTFTGDVYVNPIYRGDEPSRMIVPTSSTPPPISPDWVLIPTYHARRTQRGPDPKGTDHDHSAGQYVEQGAVGGTEAGR